MKNKNYKIMIVVSLLIIASFTWYIYCKYYGLIDCIYTNSNYKIELLPPLDKKTIYSFDFGEGEDFSILTYNSKIIKKIIDNNDFYKINSENHYEVEKILVRYQEDLCKKERNLFDQTINILDLTVKGNYYLYLESNIDKDDYFILIINPKTHLLYYFFVNH